MLKNSCFGTGDEVFNVYRYAGLYPASDEITQLPDFHPLKPGEGDTEPLPLKGPLYLFGSLCEPALEERG